MRLSYPKGPTSVGVRIAQVYKRRGKKHKSYGSTATLTDYAMLFGVLYSLISKK